MEKVLLIIIALSGLSAVSSHAERQYKQSAWIGLYDDRDTWKWSMSDPSFYGPGETEFRRWASGEPSNGHNDQCTYLDSYRTGTWNDYDCNGRTWALCFDVTERSLAPCLWFYDRPQTVLEMELASRKRTGGVDAVQEQQRVQTMSLLPGMTYLLL
ncbi:hypothetical protein JOQ06_006851 [Pogonophryne albipinna]|uniref:C-type lectin domain-containing protein n=1 Tax=Pogonophryne albipinna TaxID=1090488 RepID=A0AAD6FHQ2_9TELE|nr:hypothetical protein JOQ06_006851 [Pogonophryne albipinna]